MCFTPTMLIARVCRRVGVAASRSVHTSAATAAAPMLDNPYTSLPLPAPSLVSLDNAGVILDAATKVQNEWAATTLAERQALVRAAMAALEARAPEAAADIGRQMGKPLAQALGEVSAAASRAEGLVRLSDAALADEILPEVEGFYRKVVKEPVGVVLSICPWNYPLLTAINSVVAAVLAGNSVVLKHSPRTPHCADVFASVFAEAGAPAGLVQSLHCDNDVVNDVIRDPRTGFVSFTGSVDGGHHVYRAAASTRFVDVTLELGGKDAVYVLEDADVEKAAASAVDGGMYNAGQSCCAVERVYVARALYNDFVEAARAAADAYTLGDPMDDDTTMGPMALPDAPGILEAQVTAARAAGATVVCGGSATTDADDNGRFFAPTIVADCTHDMGLMQEESFGPVLGVMPVDSDEEAVALINDSKYGLTAALFTPDQDRAMALAPQLQVGTVFTNRCDFLDPELPWCGQKDTGKGVSLSAHGFRGVTQLKGYHFKADL